MVFDIRDENEDRGHPSLYHDTFIVLPLGVKVDDSEVYGPDEGDVQHGIVGSSAAQNDLISNSGLCVFRGRRQAGRLWVKNGSLLIISTDQ